MATAFERRRNPQADTTRRTLTGGASHTDMVRLRKQARDRDALPGNGAPMELFYLARHNISPEVPLPIRPRKAALNRFIIQVCACIPLLQ